MNGAQFLPGVPVEYILARLAKAGGKELESGKLASPESSAALAVNCIGWFIEHPDRLPPLKGLEEQTMSSHTIEDAQPQPDAAWWRHGMVWLVIGGPLLVVVASIGTAVVAYRGADIVLVETASARHVVTVPTATTPAMLARNHAATAAPR